MLLIHIFILQLEILIAISAKDYNPAELNRLRIAQFYRNHLLTRPSTKNNTYTVVAVGLGIIEVQGIDPQQQVITLNVNFELKWCDDLLRWNRSDLMCLNSRRNRSELFFTADQIWTPDIMVINGPGKDSRGVKFQYPILVPCTGIIRWSYQDKIVAFCEVDVKNFPFDRQTCSITLQSTIYDSSEFKLRSLYNVVQLYNFINTEWRITHVTIENVDLYNPHYSRNFSTLRINIELVRFSRFYILKIILPFSIISSLALFSFCLPTDTGEKIALTVSVLLSITIYLQMISNYVPKTERGFCLLTLYSNLIFSIVFLSCVFNILTMFIYFHEEHFSTQKVIKRRKRNNIINLIGQSLEGFNEQRWKLFRKRPPVDKRLKEYNDRHALEILHDLKQLRNLIMNSLVLNNFSEMRHQFFHTRQRARRLALFADQILFFIYLIVMPASLLILFKPDYRSEFSSKSTNQLLDLRKNNSNPVQLFRGCPA